MKLAILFPGIGYHTDKPLLYYSKKILKNMNYELKEIHFKNLDFDLNKSNMVWIQCAVVVGVFVFNIVSENKVITVYCVVICHMLSGDCCQVL